MTLKSRTPASAPEELVVSLRTIAVQQRGVAAQHRCISHAVTHCPESQFAIIVSSYAWSKNWDRLRFAMNVQSVQFGEKMLSHARDLLLRLITFNAVYQRLHLRLCGRVSAAVYTSAIEIVPFGVKTGEFEVHCSRICS